jgi:prophage antirepressor-like protein
MKVELWNGHAIRFVEKDKLWWAIAKDVCDALGIKDVEGNLRSMPTDYLCKIRIGETKGEPDKTYTTFEGKGDPDNIRVTSEKRKNRLRKTQDMLCLSELGIYRLIMRSNKPEALAFQEWVFNLLKSFRAAMGYEQYKLMAFTDSVKNHHLNMDLIKEALHPQGKVPYIKAQTIANKCMANIVGEPKSISKDELKEKYPEMIPLRDEVLSSAAELMALNEKYDLNLSVSKEVYRKYQGSYIGGAA